MSARCDVGWDPTVLALLTGILRALYGSLVAMMCPLRAVYVVSTVQMF